MTTRAQAIELLFETIETEGIEYIDLRFTDMLGAWHSVSQHVSIMKPEVFDEGFLFDGSSIKGWKSIQESDMILRPDPTTLMTDPFSLHPMISLICDVVEPGSSVGYARDPRSTAQRAMAYMVSTSIADTAFFGPEPEFFMFDDMRFEVTAHRSFFEIESEEAPISSDKTFAHGNTGQRPMRNAGYFITPPLDMLRDVRSEMLSLLYDMGIEVEKHHHEVATSQHELGIKYGTALEISDHLQMFKYVVKNVAQSNGRTATFMPKPLANENGSGMHVHQSLWKNGKNLFAGDSYAGLSDLALYYIGGILHHGKALNAFTNPTTNSYKRLVPGFEAPVNLVYSASNRSAACRIPFIPNPDARRVEMRFPDPTCNPYLSMSAMLMAGLDGIRRKIHPGDPVTTNMFDLSAAELEKVPHCAKNLTEALDALAADHTFLLEGGVFTADQIESYIQVKREEARLVDYTPHPLEFKLYYAS